MVKLLSRAATVTGVTDRKLTKAEIKDLCQRVIRESGLEHDGWNEGIDDSGETEISHWAFEQAARYTW